VTLENAFIIQLDGVNFFTSTKNGTVYATPFPGQAKVFTYDEADKLARQFREKEYAGAAVTDKYGAIPTVADLIPIKRSVQYEVYFSKYFFIGVNATGRELGSKDRSLSKRMSQEAGMEIVRKLKRAGHLDATILEAGSPTPDVQAEVERIWPSQKGSR
jgi:hypothetical protein